MESVVTVKKQTRTRGPGWPISEAWKRRVKADMKARGITKAELARRIPCAEGSLTVLFRPKTRQSRLVPAIHQVLHWLRPTTVSSSDELWQRIDEMWPLLTREERELVLSLVDKLAANHPRSHQPDVQQSNSAAPLGNGDHERGVVPNRLR
jgi:hypothetical protein